MAYAELRKKQTKLHGALKRNATATDKAKRLQVKACNGITNAVKQILINAAR